MARITLAVGSSFLLKYHLCAYVALENGTAQVAILRPVLLHRNCPEKADKSTEINQKNMKDEKRDNKDPPGASPAHRHLSLSLNQLHLKL